LRGWSLVLREVNVAAGRLGEHPAVCPPGLAPLPLSRPLPDFEHHLTTRRYRTIEIQAATHPYRRRPQPDDLNEAHDAIRRTADLRIRSS
jgi:hypothetical protein